MSIYIVLCGKRSCSLKIGEQQLGMGVIRNTLLSRIPGAAPSQIVSLPNHDGAQQPSEIEKMSVGGVIS
jgi:hypothetical protein